MQRRSSLPKSPGAGAPGSLGCPALGTSRCDAQDLAGGLWCSPGGRSKPPTSAGFPTLTLLSLSILGSHSTFSAAPRRSAGQEAGYLRLGL